MTKFTSASANENGKAATTTLASLYDNLLNNGADPVKLSKTFTALKKQGTEAILTIEGNDTLFVSNRANGTTLKAKAFPDLKMPKTGSPVEYNVTNIRIVKTITGV